MTDVSAAKRMRTDGAGLGSNDECHRYNTSEGCPFGDKCRYRHGATDARDLNPGGGDARAKACTKFFSTSGCPYGEGCHFNHYVPGGIAALGISVSRPPIPSMPNQSPPSFAGKPNNICRRVLQTGSCKYGDKCHFMHPGGAASGGGGPPDWMGGPEGMGGFGGRPDFGGGFRDRMGGGFGRPDGFPGPGGNMDGPMVFEPVSPSRGFGAVSNTKISVKSDMVGAIIGKAGANVKYIVKMSGAKVSVRDHDTDPSQKTVDMEGSLEQIEHATRLVKQFLADKAASMQVPVGPQGGGRGGARVPLGSHNYKTKLCDNFAKGQCTFGSRCHFAHGAEELRQPGAGGPHPGMPPQGMPY